MTATLKAYLALVLGIVLLGTAGYAHHRGALAGAAAVQQRWDAATALQEKSARDQSEAFRQTEEQRHADLQEISRNATLANDRHRADRVAAVVTHDRLRDAAAELAVIADEPARDTDPALRSDPAQAAIAVLIGLRQGADDTAGILAAYVDNLAVTADACRADYDALRRDKTGLTKPERP